MTRTDHLSDECTKTSASVFKNSSESAAIEVLIVDDDPDLVDLTATFLERERGEFVTRTETSVSDALDSFDAELDAIVSDYEMPGKDGLEFLERVREKNDDIPFLLFTGKGSEEIASEAISKGVTDYLQKDSGASQYSVLANRLLNAVKTYRAQKALERSEEKFSKLVANSTDVISIVNESGRFEYVSPAAEHILGYEQEEMIDEYVFDYAHPNDRKEAMEQFFSAVENPNEEPTVQFRFRDPDGNWPILESRGKNMLDDDAIEGFVVNSRDITQLIERENELRKQNEQLENMRKAISHDLRNPLSIASDSLTLYRETGEDTYLGKVENSIQRMDDLLDQMLRLADHDTEIDETEQVSLKEVIRSAWEMVETKDAELHVAESKEFEADSSRLQQAFENLIRNAIEHAGPEVTVTVGTIESGIYVEDDGPGIPEEEREQIFDSGYTTDHEKTGFGLTIVKQIVLGHGWDVGVTEAEAGGARFEFEGVTFQPTVYN